MENKFTKIAGVIFLVLIAIVLWPSVQNKMKSDNPAKPVVSSMDFSPFTKDTVNRIVITKGDEQKILELKDGKWMIGSDEADSEKITQLFADFSALKVQDMVSENEENQAKFEVTKDTGYVVTISANGKDSVFFFGKSAQSPNMFYVRKEGIKNVYLVSGNLRNKIAWTVDAWKKQQDTAASPDQGASAASAAMKMAPKK